MRNRTPFLFILLGLLTFTGSARPIHAAEAVTATVPAATFFPVLPFGAAPDAEPQYVPVASNHPLTGDHRDLTRVVIIVHDFSRDATRSLAELTALAGSDNDHTIIVAPQFLLESDIARFAGHLPEGGKNFARWPLGGWSMGGDSLAAPPQRGISSFTVMDLLVLFLGDKSGFPDVQQIVIAGHGEGGDFVHRYAAAGQAPDLLDPQTQPTRFVAADVSSYLYLTQSRPQTQGKQGFATPDPRLCADANNWPYGLDTLNDYAKRIGGNAIKLRYPARNVVYLAGGAVGKNDPAPDTGCAAQMQGGDRALREQNYALYLGSNFGEATASTHIFAAVPNAGYDAVALFGSKCGMAVLFGDGNCAGPLAASER